MCSYLKLRRVHVVPLERCTLSHTPVTALHKACSPIETVGGDQGVNAKTPNPCAWTLLHYRHHRVPQALQTLFPEYRTFFFTHISTLHSGGVHRPSAIYTSSPTLAEAITSHQLQNGVPLVRTMCGKRACQIRTDRETGTNQSSGQRPC